MLGLGVSVWHPAIYKKSGVFAPRIQLSPRTIAEDAAVDDVVGTLSISNPTGNWLDPITYTLLDDAGGLFKIVNDELQVDDVLDYETATFHSIEVEADNGTDAPITRVFLITITAVEEVPVVANTIADQDADENVAFTFQFAANTFSDPESGALTYTAALSSGAALPAWLTFTPSTRTFSGTPASGDVGTITVRVTATDPTDLSVYDDFTITVAAEEPPVVGAAVSGLLFLMMKAI